MRGGTWHHRGVAPIGPYPVAVGLAMLPRWVRPRAGGLGRVVRAPAAAGVVGDGPRVVIAGDLMPLTGWAVPEVAPSIRNLVGGADWFLANCEGPVSRSPERTGVPGYRRERATASWLTEVLDRLGARPGSTVLSVANNHAMDRGATGFLRTLETLEGLGIRPAGTLEGERAVPAVIRAGRIRLAVLAWTEWMNRRGPGGPARWEHVRGRHGHELAGEAEVVVGMPHWDLEMSHVPCRRTVSRARELRGRGFGLVAGCHPHVIQPLGGDARSPCAFSLGSLVGPASWLPATARLAALLEVGLDDTAARVCGYRLHLVCQLGRGAGRRLVPIDEDGGGGAALRRRIARLLVGGAEGPW